MIDYKKVSYLSLMLFLCLSVITIRAWALIPSPSQSEFQSHIDYEDGKYLQAITLLKQLLKIYPKDTGVMTDLASAVTVYHNLCTIQLINDVPMAITLYQLKHNGIFKQFRIILH